MPSGMMDNFDELISGGKRDPSKGYEKIQAYLNRLNELSDKELYDLVYIHTYDSECKYETTQFGHEKEQIGKLFREVLVSTYDTFEQLLDNMTDESEVGSVFGMEEDEHISWFINQAIKGNSLALNGRIEVSDDADQECYTDALANILHITTVGSPEGNFYAYIGPNVISLENIIVRGLLKKLNTPYKLDLEIESCYLSPYSLLTILPFLNSVTFLHGIEEQKRWFLSSYTDKMLPVLDFLNKQGLTDFTQKEKFANAEKRVLTDEDLYEKTNDYLRIEDNVVCNFTSGNSGTARSDEDPEIYRTIMVYRPLNDVEQFSSVRAGRIRLLVEPKPEGSEALFDNSTIKELVLSCNITHILAKGCCIEKLVLTPECHEITGAFQSCVICEIDNLSEDVGLGAFAFSNCVNYSLGSGYNKAPLNLNKKFRLAANSVHDSKGLLGPRSRLVYDQRQNMNIDKNELVAASVLQQLVKDSKNG